MKGGGTIFDNETIYYKDTMYITKEDNRIVNKDFDINTAEKIVAKEKDREFIITWTDKTNKDEASYCDYEATLSYDDLIKSIIKIEDNIKLIIDLKKRKEMETKIIMYFICDVKCDTYMEHKKNLGHENMENQNILMKYYTAKSLCQFSNQCTFDYLKTKRYITMQKLLNIPKTLQQIIGIGPSNTGEKYKLDDENEEK